MAEIWETLIINSGLTALLAAIKNPKKVLALRGVLIKLRDALIALNLGDKTGPVPAGLLDAANK